MAQSLTTATPEQTDVTTGVGMVTAVQANYYWVRLDLFPEQREAAMLLCTRRARLKKIGQQVWVGDRVEVEDIDWTSNRGVVAQVMPRQSELARPPVANAEQIWLVFSMTEPELDPWQLSRFLVTAESTGLAVSLGLNKCDRVSPDAQQQWHKRLSHWGYNPAIMSVQQGVGLDTVRHQLAGRISVISGPSGVGKSSLINRLIPAVDQRVTAVSGKLGRGRHTTRHVELFELPPVDGRPAGLLADTPGFNQPSLS
ncbi:MAG: ribosome small subunit-dependent GTPase A, partial [Elainellaceae cyanobacterium]